MHEFSDSTGFKAKEQKSKGGWPGAPRDLGDGMKDFFVLGQHGVVIIIEEPDLPHYRLTQPVARQCNRCFKMLNYCGLVLADVALLHYR
jgi:hypothetical protein